MQKRNRCGVIFTNFPPTEQGTDPRPLGLDWRQHLVHLHVLSNQRSFPCSIHVSGDCLEDGQTVRHIVKGVVQVLGLVTRVLEVVAVDVEVPLKRRVAMSTGMKKHGARDDYFWAKRRMEDFFIKTS